ncbi:hypothetical protein MD484_g8548, partial [Candolleomyces efflorescens]
MEKLRSLNVVPALVESGSFQDLVNDGQTISLAPSPLDGSLGVFISPHATFIADTFVIFSALQNLLKTPERHSRSLIESDHDVNVVRKLAIDFVNFIKECWVHASRPVPRPDGPLQFSGDHYRSLYTCFSLFVVLFIPESGYEQAPVGDELMEWLNTHFIEPSTEEGDLLSGLDKPWEDETFWPYLTRAILRGLNKASIFFLDALSKHPSEDLTHLTETLIPLIESQPRLQDFNTERDFAQSTRRWKDKVKALRIDMERVPEGARWDDIENWWERLSDIVGILEGRPEVLKRVCNELGGDWKEVCVAWGIFVDPRLRRQDLVSRDLVSDILLDMPPDPTNLEDNINAALLGGNLSEALEFSLKLDPWLSAHFADFMAPLHLLETNEESDLSLRDFYILAYAEYLYSDPALWRITIDYMYSCSDIGKLRADTILTRVPLQLRQQGQATNPETIERIRSGDIIGVLKDINECCLQYNREGVRRTISARAFIEERNYGLAASYCTSAEDWSGLGHIIDYVLEDHIAEHAAAIAPIIQKLGLQSNVNGVFYYRLIFVTRYARLQELLYRKELSDAASDLITIIQDDIAPASWWAVILCDSVHLLEYEHRLLFSSSQASLLLRKLEEISLKVSQGAGSEYLGVLSRMVEGKDQKEALKRLQLVRLALARQLADQTRVYQRSYHTKPILNLFG